MPKRPWTPYVITRNFAVSHLLLKMRCIFFTEQPYTDPLHRPALLPPLQSVFAKDTAFFSAKAQNSGIRLSRIPGIVCRFPAFASGNSCFISSPVQKLKNSAKQNSWRVCRFSLWNSGAVSGFGLGLLVSSGFLGAKAGHSDQRFGTETALPCANALCQNCKKLCFLRLYAGVLWRNLVLAFGKQRKLRF